MKQVETVAEHCKHEDCIYRRLISNDVPICFYAVIMCELRRCKISECDKYKRGIKRPRTKADYIDWDIDYE